MGQAKEAALDSMKGIDWRRKQNCQFWHLIVAANVAKV